MSLTIDPSRGSGTELNKLQKSSNASIAPTAIDDDAAASVIAEEEDEDDGSETEQACRAEKEAAQRDPSRLELEYHYFSFDTPLPPPNTDSVADSPAPSPPNLRPYVDPHLWPERRKALLVALSSVATFLTAYAAGSFSPPAQRMAHAFGDSLVVLLFSGITMFCIGFAVAPMLLAPLSETNGRYPVFVVSGIVFVIFQVVSAVSPDLPAILISRFFVGVGGSVFSTMVGGVIADMWHAEGRNTPMALYSGFVLIGTGAGPLFSSLITYRTTAPHYVHDHGYNGVRAQWRWVFWHQVIADTILMIALVILFRESRGPVLLSRKAHALNQWYESLERAGYYGVWMSDAEAAHDAEHRHALVSAGCNDDPMGVPPTEGENRRLRRVRWLVKDDENRATVMRMITTSVYRPFHMLFTEPVVFFFSLWVSFAWAVLYLTFGSIPLVYERVYGWNIEQAGYVFISMIVGSVVATTLGVFQDRLVRAFAPARLQARLNPDVPESRLYSVCIIAMLLPVGLFIFGYTARPDYHWIAPMIGIGLATAGIFSVYLATFNYFADCYHRFASSALAAQSFCRNMLGGVFPLVMRPLFTNLGIQHACALLGSIAIGLTFVPWVLLFFGEKIRRRSKFAMSLAGT